MIKSQQAPSQFWNRLLLIVSVPISMAGFAMLMTHTYNSTNWMNGVTYFIWAMSPIFFYTEILKFKDGHTRVTVTSGKLFKCRVRGTDEVFYLNCDTEEEAELFFEVTMKDKIVFIEEANIKIFGFSMILPKGETPNET